MANPKKFGELPIVVVSLLCSYAWEMTTLARGIHLTKKYPRITEFKFIKMNEITLKLIITLVAVWFRMDAWMWQAGKDFLRYIKIFPENELTCSITYSIFFHLISAIFTSAYAVWVDHKEDIWRGRPQPRDIEILLTRTRVRRTPSLRFQQQLAKRWLQSFLLSLVLVPLAIVCSQIVGFLGAIISLWICIFVSSCLKEYYCPVHNLQRLTDDDLCERISVICETLLHRSPADIYIRQNLSCHVGVRVHFENLTLNPRISLLLSQKLIDEYEPEQIIACIAYEICWWKSGYKKYFFIANEARTILKCLIFVWFRTFSLFQSLGFEKSVITVEILLLQRLFALNLADNLYDHYFRYYVFKTDVSVRRYCADGLREYLLMLEFQGESRWPYPVPSHLERVARLESLDTIDLFRASVTAHERHN